MQVAHGVPVWRVGVGSTNGLIGPRLLDAPSGVSAGTVHVCRADGHERSRVPRRAPVRHFDRVRDACAEPVVEPAVRGVSGGPLVRRQCDDDAMLCRLRRRTGYGYVRAMLSRHICADGQRLMYSMLGRTLRWRCEWAVLTVRSRLVLCRWRCSLHGMEHLPHRRGYADTRLNHSRPLLCRLRTRRHFLGEKQWRCVQRRPYLSGHGIRIARTDRIVEP